MLLTHYPTLKRWAIIEDPSGMKMNSQWHGHLAWFPSDSRGGTPPELAGEDACATVGSHPGIAPNFLGNRGISRWIKVDQNSCETPKSKHQTPKNFQPPIIMEMNNKGAKGGIGTGESGGCRGRTEPNLGF